MMVETGTAITTAGLGKRYGRRWALQDCSLRVPRGRIAALIGPNGAGKSTLLRMASGITHPSAGEIRVLGRSPEDQTVEVLSRIGYLDQERPLYRFLRVQETLRIGRRLNSNWDEDLARSYLAQLGIGLRERISSLSIGQQAQVALTMCLAKRPDVLLLDEPLAALDPLARDQLMGILLSSVAESATTVVMSSHVTAELETVCDYVIILLRSRVALADDLDEILATHRLLVGAPGQSLPENTSVVSRTDSARQATYLVRADLPVVGGPWDVLDPTLNEIVLAYMRDSPQSFGEAARSSASASSSDPEGSEG
jgi:ABC-2 type transport system ATP-binding protein